MLFSRNERSIRFVTARKEKHARAPNLPRKVVAVGVLLRGNQTLDWLRFVFRPIYLCVRMADLIVASNAGLHEMNVCHVRVTLDELLHEISEGGDRVVHAHI